MLADDIAAAIAKANRKSWQTGTVAAVTGNTATVVTRGQSVTGVHWLTRGDAWTPAVGSVVFMIGGGRQLLILGNIS